MVFLGRKPRKESLASVYTNCETAVIESWGGSTSLRPRSAALLLGIFLSTFFLNRLDAQTATSGGVTGVVTDQSRAVVPNANVEIRDINKGTTESTRTDRDGVYRFFFLSPSQYTLNVEHGRFRKEVRSVTVLLGTPVTVNITLEIAKANMNST